MTQGIQRLFNRRSMAVGHQTCKNNLAPSLGSNPAHQRGVEQTRKAGRVNIIEPDML